MYILQSSLLKYIWKWQNYAAFQPRQFLNVLMSCRTVCKWTGLLRIMSGPQSLQIWTHWTITSGCLAGKVTWTPAKVKTTEELKVFKSLCRPSGMTCHKSTSARRRRTSPSAWLPTWLCLPLVLTSSICGNSIHLQVCILISSQNK